MNDYGVLFQLEIESITISGKLTDSQMLQDQWRSQVVAKGANARTPFF